MTIRVLIGIGSNLNNPKVQVANAFNALAQLPKSKLIRCSSLYQSLPQGPQDQDLFINAVSLLETELSPHDLLQNLKNIEREFGRVKKRHWGERIIDLDILFYGKQKIETPELQIPHVQAMSRDFVMMPSLEIAPDWELPNGEPLVKYQSQCLDHKLLRLPKS